MLARQLPGASVLSSGDRYLAGRLAEHHLGATVHVLDDGFQHLQLDRDVDLVIVAGEDLEADARTLPGGRLREPPDTLLAADVILAADDRVLELGPRPRHAPFEVFRLRRTMGPVKMGPVKNAGTVGSVQGEADVQHDRGVERGGIDEPAGERAVRSFAVAGIARPQAFFAGLRAAGHDLAGTRAFRDHHRYSRADLDRACHDARTAGAARILTTEKDFVRLLPFRPFAMPVGWVPLTMEPDPLPEFRRWLAGALAGARDLWPEDGRSDE
jgi:tetraacyldisaccharide 4'-kinase